MNDQLTKNSGSTQGGLSSFLVGGSAPHKEDIHHVFVVLLNGKWIIAFLTLLGILCGALYLYVTPKTYVAAAQVVIDTREQRPTESESVVSNMEVTASAVAGEVVAMRSNVLLERVVDELRLTEVDEFLPEDPDIRAVMSADARKSHATASLARRLDVRQMGISYAILISFASGDPELAAAVANEVALQYISDQISLKRDATIQATSFLQKRIDELAAQVEASEEAVVEFRRDLIARLGADQTANEQLLAELNTEFVTVSSSLTDLSVRLETASRLYESGGIDAVQDVITSPLLATLASEQATLAGERARLATSLGELHPDLVRIEAQLNDLERSMQDELGKRLEALRREVDVAKDNRDALLTRINEVQDRLNQFQSASVRLGQLERAAEASRLVYADFLERFTEMDAQADFQAPQARLVGKAIPSSVPASPKTASVLTLSTVAGFSLGIAAVLLRSAIRRPITSVQQLENLTGLPVLAALPFISTYRRWLPFNSKRSHTETLDRFTERVRSLRSRLFLKSHGKKRILMVTSALPSEGKSLLSLTLANTLHRIGKSVVILDADLRRSHSAGDLGLTKTEACLVDFLAADGEPSEELIQSDQDFEVDVVAPMRRSDQASDLLAAPAFGKLISFLRDRYDYIIIDSPPVISMADTQIIAQHSEWAILVVKNQHTRDQLVSSALHQIMDSGVTVVGTVLSQVRASEMRSDELYGYYYE